MSYDLDNLFEHRGKPDPRKLADREAMHERGKVRHKNALEREREYEERLKERNKRRKELESLGKSKSYIESQLGTQKEFDDKYKFDEEKENPKPKKTFSDKENAIAAQEKQRVAKVYRQMTKKQNNPETENKHYDDYNKTVDKAKEESDKNIDSVKAHNSHQAKGKRLIKDSVSYLKSEIDSSMRDGKAIDLDEVVKNHYEKSSDKFYDFMKNQKLKDEDEWVIDDEPDVKWSDKYVNKEKEKSFTFDDEDDYEDDYEENKKQNDYYNRKLKRTQDEYRSKAKHYAGNEHELDKLKKEYNPKIKNIKDKIKQTDIKSYNEYVAYRKEKSDETKQKLRKNPVVNWFKMNYFKAIHPFVKTFSAIEGFRAFLWDE